MRLRLLIAFVLALPIASSVHAQVDPVLDKFVIGDPPAASARMAFDDDSKVIGTNDTIPTIAKRLGQTLTNHGYVEQGWFRVSLDKRLLRGYAVLTRAERIDEGGNSIMQDRFSQEPFTTPVTSVQDYFSKLLLHAPAGRYRVFLFYIIGDTPGSNNQPQKQQAVSPVTISSMNGMFVGGSRVPPHIEANFLQRPFVVTAYVYVWDRSTATGTVEFEKASATDAKSHLIAAKLWEELGAK